MPIISQVGRKSLRIRLLFALMYIILITGAVTMIYPFMIMLSATMTNRFDYADFSPIPPVFKSETTRFKKHLFEQYGSADLNLLAANYRAPWQSFEELKLDPDLKNYRRAPVEAVTDYRSFLATLNRAELSLTFFPDLADHYPEFLQQRYERQFGDNASALTAVRRAYAEHIPQFNQITLQPENHFALPNWIPSSDIKFQDWLAFKNSLPLSHFTVISGSWYYRRDILRRHGTLEAANAAWGTHYRQMSELRFPPDVLTGEQARDWSDFVG